MATITYDDKVALISNPNPEINKWTADDANEVKTVVNANAAAAEVVANKDIDGTLAANSDTKYPSQKAVKTYVDAQVGGGGGHVIEDEGTPLTQRTKLNFVGAGVTVTDDSGDDASVVTIPAATAILATTITNGDTTHAPDGNSVFDALALKCDQLTTFRRLTGSHTLDATDLASINAGDDEVIEMNVASANDLTIPLNATQAFPIGTKITIIQYGVGLTSVVATGGVTLNTSAGDANSRGQYAPMLLEKVATDEWYLTNGTTPGQVVSSGTFTPTLTNTTNVAASTAYQCQYLRVGSTVTVSGKVSIDPTSTGDTVLGMSIPIASAFSQEYHAGGAAVAYAVAGLSAAIFADATNDRLTVRFTAVDTSNRDFFFNASYTIV